MTPLPLQAWAARHAIPAYALAELMAIMAPPSPVVPDPGQPASEGYVQSAVRLEAARCGVWLTRNNVGALQDKTGRPVRYGLANESKAQNERMKSADLIGIRAVEITPAMVGSTIGQFVSRECKHAEWKPGEDREREAAQLAWAALVTRYGGDAKIVTGPGSFGS